MKYPILLFDADGTLLDFSRSEYEALSDTLSAFSLPDSAEIHSIYSQANAKQWELLEKGLTTREHLKVDRFRAFCSACSFSADPGRLAGFYENALATKSYLIDGAFDVCRKLSGKCRLYLITNGFRKIQQGRFDASPIASFFRDKFISEDIGAEKPSAEYFDYVKSHIPSFDAGNALVIGDSLTSDILGGIRAGIDVCWYNPQNKIPSSDLCINYTIHSLYELEQLL